LTGVSYPDVRVERYVRPDRPAYWVATHGERAFWSYELNPIRVWGANCLGDSVVSLAGEHDLSAKHGYLPLPVARYANLVSPALAGPVSELEYRYPMNPGLRDEILSLSQIGTAQQS
jgi:hypothetical protein